ncbi:MAG: FKBP-type peptidyl-prolyl cis-trans isomerase [Bacteroidia bacterium]|nr:FKBP-type peptidyl-prolyl cis-trans isomerase [Bacteroidia bacterium]
MKKVIFWFAAAALLLSGCAKGVKTGTNDATKRYIEAFAQTYYPTAKTTALGSYIIESKTGSGPAVGDAETYPFVYVDYSAWDLDGQLVYSTDVDLMKKTGLYSASTYCGPAVWYRLDTSLLAGLDEIVSSMNEGGEVTALIPGWLATNNRYDTAQGYLDNVDGASTSAIYNVKLISRISDLGKWQIDSIGRYLSHNFPYKSVADSSANGMYIIPVDTPSQETHQLDSTFYVNYIGRLLDGTVFDTNIKDTAKVYGLYSSSRTYGPTSVKVSKSSENENETTVSFGGSTPITGFAFALKKIHKNEKIVTIFYSNHGYGANSTGGIPAYSPLRFDIEAVEKK